MFHFLFFTLEKYFFQQQCDVHIIHWIQALDRTVLSWITPTSPSQARRSGERVITSERGGFHHGVCIRHTVCLSTSVCVWVCTLCLGGARLSVWMIEQAQDHVCYFSVPCLRGPALLTKSDGYGRHVFGATAMSSI